MNNLVSKNNFRVVGLSQVAMPQQQRAGMCSNTVAQSLTQGCISVSDCSGKPGLKTACSLRAEGGLVT
jgi:hypothetical protein